MPKVPMERIIALKQKRACLTSQSLSQSLARRTPHGRTTGLRGLPLSLIQVRNGHGEVFFLDSHTIPTT